MVIVPLKTEHVLVHTKNTIRPQGPFNTENNMSLKNPHAMPFKYWEHVFVVNKQNKKATRPRVHNFRK